MNEDCKTCVYCLKDNSENEYCYMDDNAFPQKETDIYLWQEYKDGRGSVCPFRDDEKNYLKGGKL